ncbi:MAG: CaiB/BaiF CoA-transferase family protein [Candidatus Binatus sp.]|jgi:crotonobetainyl-CoA:carnitine CoA-transferase CaiB-like acyl-CoA transferase|uniref:CaiB/BaiF CoA transferase family protein n=1 Tax=Candidatus Binatus sp. TaxID=2811406 RepID=UPI003D0B2CF0
MTAPLDGIKVLDLTKLAPGPFCTMILADLGAEVIKIEEPGPPTGRRADQAGAAGTQGPVSSFSSSPYNALGRNKQSIGINLKSGAGKEIYFRLAERADVIVEEYRPGVAKRLGIDYEQLSPRNPRLIYCAITGFGQNGPYRDLVGHDINYIGTAGVLSLLGRPGQPPTIPHNLIADYAGGGMHGAIGVLAALVARSQTGRGQYVDISMMDGSLAILAQAFSAFFAGGKLPQRGETIFDGGIPNYNVYLTKDGKYITIAAIEPWFFANLCRAIGREDFIAHEFDSSKRAEIARVFTETFKTKTRDEWFAILTRNDICAGRMLTLDEVPSDPQVLAREMIVEVEGPGGQKIKQVGVSVKFSDTPGSIRSLAPQLGQHTDEILGALGYAQDEIDRWREAGAIK